MACASLRLSAAGRSSDIAEGIRIAAEMIDSGKALKVLDEFIRVSNEAV